VLKLANQAIAAPGESAMVGGSCPRIRKRICISRRSCVGQAGMLMGGLNRCSTENEAEQSKRQHARKHGVRSIEIYVSSSGHDFFVYGRVLNYAI
jgi:hypothetical protein